MVFRIDYAAGELPNSTYHHLLKVEWKKNHLMLCLWSIWQWGPVSRGSASTMLSGEGVSGSCTSDCGSLGGRWTAFSFSCCVAGLSQKLGVTVQIRHFAGSQMADRFVWNNWFFFYFVWWHSYSDSPDWTRYRCWGCTASKAVVVSWRSCIALVNELGIILSYGPQIR